MGDLNRDEVWMLWVCGCVGDCVIWDWVGVVRLLLGCERRRAAALLGSVPVCVCVCVSWVVGCVWGGLCVLTACQQLCCGAVLHYSGVLRPSADSSPRRCLYRLCLCVFRST